eukprot:jgi/Hompol1/4332/HPOL_003622-RA
MADGVDSADAEQETEEQLPKCLLDSLEALRKEASTRKFDDKKQFPGALVPLVKRCVYDALDFLVHGDRFYNELSQILPYSVVVLKRIVVKLAFPDRLLSTKDTVSSLYTRLQTAVDTAVQNQLKAASTEAPSQGTDAAADPSAQKPKFKWNDEVRVLMWNILCMEWELADLDNISSVLLGGPERFGQPAVRKAVYSKMCSFWPQTPHPWMDTNALSLQYSMFRKRLIKLRARQSPHSNLLIGNLVVRRDPFAQAKRVPSTGQVTSNNGDALADASMHATPIISASPQPATTNYPPATPTPMPRNTAASSTTDAHGTISSMSTLTTPIPRASGHLQSHLTASTSHTPQLNSTLLFPLTTSNATGQAGSITGAQNSIDSGHPSPSTPVPTGASSVERKRMHQDDDLSRSTDRLSIAAITSSDNGKRPKVLPPNTEVIDLD